MRGFYVNQKEGNEPKLINNLPIPSLLNGEALIQIYRAGICATDREIICGYKDGFHGILGHEFVGIVRDISSNNIKLKENWIGKRVVGDINIVCKTCEFCLDKSKQDRGRNHCPNRSCLGIVNKDGAFADYISLPIENLHIVPDNISDDIAVFVEPLAAAYRIVEQDIITSTDSIAIVGDGKLGLLITEVLAIKYPNSPITLIGKHIEKLNLAPENVEKIVFNEKNVLSSKFDVVVECSGTNSGLNISCEMVKPMGKIVLKTTCSHSHSNHKMTIDAMNNIVIKEIKVVGSRCGPFGPAILLLKHPKLNLQKYLTATFRFEEIIKAFEYTNRKGCLKVQLIMENQSE